MNSAGKIRAQNYRHARINTKLCIDTYEMRVCTQAYSDSGYMSISAVLVRNHMRLVSLAACSPTARSSAAEDASVKQCGRGCVGELRMGASAQRYCVLCNHTSLWRGGGELVTITSEVKQLGEHFRPQKHDDNVLSLKHRSGRCGLPL